MAIAWDDFSEGEIYPYRIGCDRIALLFGRSLYANDQFPKLS
jgi:hypothetical protein